MTSGDLTPQTRGMARAFVIEEQAGPENVPRYLTWAAPGALEQPFGDVTRIEAPSFIQYGAYDVVGELPGQVENATLPLTFQSKLAKSDLFDLSRRRCPYDIQLHIGQCDDPRDFDAGWSVIWMLERVRTTTFSTDDLGSLASGDESKVTEEVETSALRLYQVLPMTYAERAKDEVTAEIIAIAVCDKPECGDCGSTSDGCQKVFAISAPAGSSPGLIPEVIYSDDGLTTAGDTTITTLAVGEDPDDLDCVGQNLVVVSEDSLSMHYADIDDILTGTETWTEVATGFVAAHGPRAISSYSPRDTWIAAAGGYIYFTTNPADGVTVQDAGVATTEDLNDIYAFSTKEVVAVGANNAVIYTTNGGDTWIAVTGPAPAIALNAVFIRKSGEWWVGTAGGELYYTLDSGNTWTEKGFPGNNSGAVEAIIFASDTVGFMSHTTAAGAARILRTISGGNTWYVQPEGTGSTPTADKINSLAVCQDEANVLYGGGLAGNAADGILIKGTAN